MAGRPRVLCETKQREICLLVATGCTIEASARHVGCTPLTIRRETRRNPQFSEQLRRSRASAEITPIQTMRQAAASEWRAAAWLLERTQPDRYAKRPPNMFSQQDIVALLGRACEFFRCETGDAENFARIKRRVESLAQRPNAPAKKPATLPRLDESNPVLTPAVKTQDVPSSSAPSRIENERPAEHANDQNGTKLDEEMICLADVTPSYAKRYAEPLGST